MAKNAEIPCLTCLNPLIYFMALPKPDPSLLVVILKYWQNFDAYTMSKKYYLQ